MTSDTPPPPAVPAYPRGPRPAAPGSASSSQLPSRSNSAILPSSSPPQAIFLPSPGSTSPTKSRRDAPGSSRTKYFSPQPTSPSSPDPAPARISPTATVTVTRPDSEPLIDIGDSPTPNVHATELEQGDDDAPHAPYREPEAVIEPMDEPLPDYSIAEHPITDDDMLGLKVGSPSRQDSKSSFDISSWQNAQQPYEPMYMDEIIDQPDRPAIGGGCFPRLLLEQLHSHPLYQPRIDALPRPHKRSHGSSQSMSETAATAASISTSAPDTTPNPNASPTSTAHPLPETNSVSTASEYSKVATIADVWNACPGGESNHHEWYFCPICWAWIRIIVGKDQDFVKSLEDRDPVPADWPNRQWLISEHLDDWTRYKDLTLYRSIKEKERTSQTPEHHFHTFSHLVDGVREKPLPRIEVDAEANAFPHLIFGLEQPVKWTEHEPPMNGPIAHIDSLSDLCVFIDCGMVPGQLSPNLVNDFTTEKMSNPQPGVDAMHSVKNAWTLILTLLGNALFRKQRGWVQLENSKFKNTIGVSLASSNLLYQIGFGCRQEQNVFRVGPFNAGDSMSQEQAEHMDAYMLRAWVEISMYLALFAERHDLQITEDVTSVPLHTILHKPLDMDFYPPLQRPIAHKYTIHAAELGCSKYDLLETMLRGYDLQMDSNPPEAPEYLGALEELANSPYVGKEALQMKVATERSLGRFNIGELEAAYKRIGYDYEIVGVPSSKAPEEYVLELHKAAVQAAAAAWERQELSAALLLIGRARQSKTIIKVAKSGQTYLSVDDAYAALSAPQDCTDDGLIMQYEMAVADYPGKSDHYRKCMEIIANAPGQERPGVKTFLETGHRDAPPPARKDIPVGLQNIGNTCYLNSILQYLYSIKPLRDAVLSFEQDGSGAKISQKPEVERSRRFVRQLRLLFLQLYKSEESSVRPEEELAYLAITRPEVDQIVAPEVQDKTTSILDAIPSIPSPSSTRVGTPDFSPTIPNTSLPSSPRPDIERSSSILGKRTSTDRDDSSHSSADRSRLKSDPFEDLGNVTPVHEDKENIVQDDETPAPLESPSAVTDFEGLELKSPELEDPPELIVPPPLPPRPPLIKKDTLASGLRFGLQQDSAEVLINVLTQLEMAFDPAVADAGSGEARRNIISELFSCKYRQQTFYASATGEVEAQTPVESVFVHPIIGVEEEGKDLYDCLGELYLKGDEIEYEGKNGYMMDLMDSFPPMLYIQMRRSQYDPRTGRETKTNTHIGFGQTLRLDRFLASADKAKREASVEITREMTRIRARLHQLRNHKPKSIPDTFTHVREALGVLSEDPELEITEDFLQALDGEAEAVKHEIASLEEKLPELKRKLDAIWTEGGEYDYELVSVFMHRGKTSGAGHYWTYQAHLPDRPDEFFKYNDETVTAVPASEVLEDRTGSDANPALLCYVRKGRDLVDTLHREILELESVNQTVGGA